MNAKQHFDEDYVHVRRMLLLGKFSIQDAKNWVHQIGCRTETRMLKEQEEKMDQVWGTNTARETAKERLMFGKSEEKDNDD